MCLRGKLCIVFSGDGPSVFSNLYEFQFPYLFIVLTFYDLGIFKNTDYLFSRMVPNLGLHNIFSLLDSNPGFLEENHRKDIESFLLRH